MTDKTGVDSVANDSVMTANAESMIIGDNNNRTIIRTKNHILIPVHNEPVHNEPVLIGNTS